jgi:hypothetical protein
VFAVRYLSPSSSSSSDTTSQTFPSHRHLPSTPTSSIQNFHHTYSLSSTTHTHTSSTTTNPSSCLRPTSSPQTSPGPCVNPSSTTSLPTPSTDTQSLHLGRQERPKPARDRASRLRLLELRGGPQGTHIHPSSSSSTFLLLHLPPPPPSSSPSFPLHGPFAADARVITGQLGRLRRAVGRQRQARQLQDLHLPPVQEAPRGGREGRRRRR